MDQEPALCTRPVVVILGHSASDVVTPEREAERIDAVTVDRSFVDLNRKATERMRRLASRLSDEDLRTPVGPDWTVAIVFAHLAFTERRARYVLDATEHERTFVNPDYNIFVNDVALPFMAAMPPREAADLAIATAEAMDQKLEAYPADLLELVHAGYPRFVFRSHHRNEHLDEAEAALKAAGKG